jgi:hypothetical protein
MGGTLWFRPWSFCGRHGPTAGKSLNVSSTCPRLARSTFKRSMTDLCIWLTRDSERSNVLPGIASAPNVVSNRHPAGCP